MACVGVWQDKAGVLIVFLCTSSSVSHYSVQTRADVYSAETSKSTALGCNLVTSFFSPPAAGSSNISVRPRPLPGVHWSLRCCQIPTIDPDWLFLGINPM
ncbi:hypothetical protein EYF80_032721 [Liparis tanakae]|uniref:Secreted protein n=1 Tax=Liparis tanakae TaxID=230148 RepID=A0A4Z2GU49_9TELE|nr:hypothetical protein EYF80_032721 [Liparis tanakae]